ncbi:biotin-dependent carboxyltransferase family protein [Ureibacillus sp. 179-F W5.1 NHS]|uniref:Biotin-dependent carboxyltransferase family protein n=1 Tax=Lysinibacillus halotolerans TaxID=1368476 RepID=A0A3M8H8T2_9BACI|nr:biotin-dependent carboxyltransferase family protein [Lysinibacillus halotolerans]RNC98634.1 biotin-dependent carboxyltransferase family protein [Lysinibacillus halotolerans]
MKPLLKVVRKGVFSSLQDNGRFGYRRFGIPTAGPMDRLSFQLGNKIAENTKGNAALEIFYGGMTFQSVATHEYILVGANMNATVNGSGIEPWKTFVLKEGDLLKLKFSPEGAIAYLIPLGGFKGEEMLNSQSTYLKAGIGCPVMEGIILYGENLPPNKYRKGLYPKWIPSFSDAKEVRVVVSHHIHYFKDQDIERFFSSNYQLSAGDRMGYCLKGLPIHTNRKVDLLSEPTMFGTIQVPPNGQPIVLMADAQTVGGYPTIGKIVEEDLWKVAQLRIGDCISFRKETFDGKAIYD